MNIRKTRIPDKTKRPQWAAYWAQDAEGDFYWLESIPRSSDYPAATAIKIQKVTPDEMINVAIYDVEKNAEA